MRGGSSDPRVAPFDYPRSQICAGRCHHSRGHRRARISQPDPFAYRRPLDGSRPDHQHSRRLPFQSRKSHRRYRFSKFCKRMLQNGSGPSPRPVSVASLRLWSSREQISYRSTSPRLRSEREDGEPNPLRRAVSHVDQLISQAPMTPRKSASQDSRKFDIFGASTCSPQWGTAEAPFQVSLDSPVSSGSSDGDHQVQSDNSEGGLARPRVLTPEAAHEVTTNIAKSFDPTRSPAMLFPSPATIAPGCLHTVMTRELPQPPPPVARSDGSRPPIASPQHGRFKRPFYPIETSNVRGATTPSPVRSQSGMMPSSPMVPQSSCHTLSMQLAQATQRPLNPVCGSSSAIVPLTNRRVNRADIRPS